MRFLELFRHMLGLLGRVISPSQGLYLHRTTQHIKTRDKHPCLERDSNPRSQQPTGQDPRLRPHGHCDRRNKVTATYKSFRWNPPRMWLAKLNWPTDWSAGWVTHFCLVYSGPDKPNLLFLALHLGVKVKEVIHKTAFICDVASRGRWVVDRLLSGTFMPYTHCTEDRTSQCHSRYPSEGKDFNAPTRNRTQAIYWLNINEL
jgi:hypothetical protein